MKTFVYIGTSLDGFIAERDGNLDWLEKFANQEVTRGYGEFIKNIDAIVIGRGTYEKVLTFPSWPYEKAVFVLSSTLKSLPDSLRGKATIVSMQPRPLLQFLAKEGFSNIYVDGGKVIQAFLRDDCIDEMIISKVPVLLGRGIPLFGFLDKPLQFDHLHTETFSNGLVKGHYRRIRI